MIRIDMQMPDNCVECRFNVSEFGYCNAMPVEFVGQVSDFEKDGKPEWCPLKAQEPRVMTFSEVKKHYNLPPVFVDDLDAQEDYYQDIQPLYFDFPNPTPFDVHWRNSDKVRTYLDKWEYRYNKTWRCWTSRPDQATREAVKWDG